MRFVVEVDEIAGAHVDGADAEAHLAGIDPVEVDKPLERALQQLGFVEAGSASASGRNSQGASMRG